MLAAIIAAVIAALVAIVVVVLVFFIRSRNAAPKTGQVKQVQQLDTVGVGSSPLSKKSAARSALEGEVRVSDGPTATKNPADGLSRRFAGLGVATAAILGTIAARL